MIIGSEEGRGGDGVRKRAKGIRSEGSRNEKRGLFTKKNSSLKLLSHWKGKAADQLSFSFCLFLTHKPHTKTHSLSPPHRHRHHQTHTYAHTQPKRTMGAGRRLRHIVTPQLSCGIGCAFVTGTRENKPERSKQEQKPFIWSWSSRLEALQSDDVCLTSYPDVFLMEMTSQMVLTLLQVPVLTRKKAGWWFNSILVTDGILWLWPHCCCVCLLFVSAVCAGCYEIRPDRHIFPICWAVKPLTWYKNQTHMLHLLESCSPPVQKLVCANRWLAKLDNPIYYTAQWAESIYLIGQDGLYL